MHFYKNVWIVNINTFLKNMVVYILLHKSSKRMHTSSIQDHSMDPHLTLGNHPQQDLHINHQRTQAVHPLYSSCSQIYIAHKTNYKTIQIKKATNSISNILISQTECN